MRYYKCLNKSIYNNEFFSLVPIRDDDKYQILKMRNEQLYHLRQKEKLTVAQQEDYFKNVVSSLFKQENPNQILFSLLHESQFVGYGGLVHINWIDRNAEISFIMKTKLQEESFEYYWIKFISLLENLAFKELHFHKIYTYAFDLRPHLYTVLQKCGFIEEARLSEHCYFDGKYIDVVIHSKIANNVEF